MIHDRVQTATILVGGEWRPAASGDCLPVYAPDTGEVTGSIARGGAQDVDAAVAAARAAFEGPWGRTAPVELVGRCALGPGASLAVVRFDGRDLLLGVSGSGSVLLAERAAGKQG